MTTFKKLFLTSLLVVSVFPLNLFADVNVIPRVWVGISEYDYNQAPRKGAMPDGSDFPEVEFDATFIMKGVGITTAYNGFYLDLAYQDSSEEKDSFSDANFYERFKGDREEYSITLGMRVLDNRGNIYLGYKDGDTQGRGEKGTTLNFTEDGFFIGASYGWVIAEAGLFSVNLAYADLDGNLRENPGAVYPPGLGMDADSETTGLSYGISWSGKISERMGYSISLDANDYEFDNLKDNTTTTALPSKIEEKLITGKISLSYRF